MIPFNQPSRTGDEEKYVLDALRSQRISGEGQYTQKCHKWFEEHLGCYKALLTPSCTHALEMAAILINIQPGDEVIMPSYTFVSTANAFVLRGATVVFVDIRPDTMNMDEKLIESAITAKTKAIVPVHYAGVACEMETIMAIAEQYNLFVIEDAAQGMMATYKKRSLGTIGHMGVYSFHETKNYTSGGEGGLLIVNDEQFVERAEFIREKGTDRNKFFRGMIDKYSWVDIGSSYLPSELQAAYLWAQLEHAERIDNQRLTSWTAYYEQLLPLQREGYITLPTIPDTIKYNGHMFYIKVATDHLQRELIAYLKAYDIQAVFHYIPLHSSVAGRKHGRFNDRDQFTTVESRRLVRLPMYYKITIEDIRTVTKTIHRFFDK
ncbi:MAG: dTDP-4-amino-4,6-dideoxygalactose transaminase [Proteobacteria bacterium]|nr:dTDP-4-amino-4,6-dideoxygalactose transaminase [Pseudomonadota bacterium]